MDVREALLLFFALWLFIAAVVTPSVSVYLTIALIGILIVLELGEFYLPKPTKETLKFSAYMLLIAFAFIVAKKVYEIVK